MPSDYFPSATAGDDQSPGMTVLTRPRPEYQEPGIQLGGFTLHPDFDQSIFANSNVTGSAGGTGSWGTQTAGGVSGQSDWSRNSFEESLGFDHFQYFALPSDQYTDWNVDLGGGYTIGDSQLRASYAHSSLNQLGSSLGAAASQTPSLDTTDRADLSYTFDFGRFEVTPSLDLSAFRFGDITTNGVPQSQASLNRNTLAAAVVTRYELTGAAGLVFVARGTGSNFIDPQPGQPSNNSTSVTLLTGLDYQAKSVWRYSLLLGLESSHYAASQYASETTPAVSAQVIYTPTGVLTVTGNLTRFVEHPDVAGTEGYVLTEANLVVDYELLRNILLQGRAEFQHASYLLGGTQSTETLGGGVTWLLTRRMRLSLNDDFTNQGAPGGTSGLPASVNATNISGAYSQNILMLTLHLGL